MMVRFKKTSPFAVEPTKATSESAGFDLVAISVDVTEDFIEYDTGIAIELPMGFSGLLFPRSSVSKKELFLANGVGLIDSDYRGTLRFRFRYNPDGDADKRYKVGDKVGQLVVLPLPKIEFRETSILSDSVRAEGGFGSTGE